MRFPTAAGYYARAQRNMLPTDKDRADIRKLVPLLHLMQGFCYLMDELELLLKADRNLWNSPNVRDWWRNLSRKTETMTRETYNVFTRHNVPTLPDDSVGNHFAERSGALMDEVLATITDRSLNTMLGLCGSVLSVCEDGIKGMSWYVTPVILNATANVFRHLCDYLPKSDRDFRDIIRMQLNDFMKRANTIEVVD